MHLNLLFPIIQWLLALIVALLAAFGRDPLLFEYRAWALPLGFGAGVFLGGLAGRNLWQRRSPERLVLLLVCLAAVATLGWREALFRDQRARVLNSAPESLRVVGRHVVVGYTDLRELMPLVESGAVGGVFITRRNVAGLSAAQVRENVAAMQTARQRGGLCPLIVATDQEGGSISRMSPPLTALPALARWLEEPGNNARAYGEIHGRELASVGVNVNFAPLADLKPAAPSGALDFHSKIGQRAISADPRRVAEVTGDYVAGLGKFGVKGTLKHFPGLGRVAADTHHFSASLDTPQNVLENSDWLPFRHTLAQSDALLMLGHVKLTALDKDIPASYSRNVVHGLLREAWRHDGVLITDDLTMGAIYRSREGIAGASAMALDAGVDLLLVSYDTDKVYDVLAALLTAAGQAGKLDAATLSASNARLNRTFGWACR